MVKRIVSITLMALGLALVSTGTFAAGDGVPMPKPSKAVKGEKCVEPADIMRREHMVFLKHQRDDTLRKGIRGEKYGLNECVDCHATKSPKIAQGKVRTVVPFCAECHKYAAVKIDCFECHTGAADDKPKRTSLNGAPLPEGHPETGADSDSLLMSKLESYLGNKAAGAGGKQ